MTANTPEPKTVAIEFALARARALAAAGERRLLGIAGMPGSGKSTLAARVAAELGGLAVCVPMDGFHLAGAELARLGRRERKGAADTFDVAGYIALLRRLREPEPGVTVYAPAFDRVLEEPVAGTIAVESDVPLVVTEGNYLLLWQRPWAAVRPLLDEAWYAAVRPEVRVARLMSRHAGFGKTEEQARHWSRGSDQVNADLVAPTWREADLVVALD
ncbi:MAG: nucleoside/nucleotide kinase family protein [Candidatus Dormibacteraeota bacterium]|nr:nucleoside/nucleotide kinase family protein [Candidatus Dormibacteraeota bacterium]